MIGIIDIITRNIIFFITRKWNNLVIPDFKQYEKTKQEKGQ